MWRGMLGWGACAVFGLALCGCEGEKRPYTYVRANLPDASATGASTGSEATRAENGLDTGLPLAGGDGEIAIGALGAACRQGSECSSGNCVDAVCCDSPCAEL